MIPQPLHPPSRGKPSPNLLLSTLLLFLLCLAQDTYFIQAQSPPPTSFKPLSTVSPAFARTATKLYICSGNNTSINRPQFFSIDLSVPWNSSQPAWKELADGPTQLLFPAVFSVDEQTMVTFHSGTTFAMRYSVATNTWSPSKVNVTYGTFQGVNAVTDPTTGIVYLAAGYTSARSEMSVYDFAKDSMVSSPDPMPAPATIFQARTYYQNVFSKRRNSILYFGGYDSAFGGLPTQNVMTEFVPTTGVWRTLVREECKGGEEGRGGIYLAFGVVPDESESESDHPCLASWSLSRCFFTFPAEKSATGTPPPMRADHCMATSKILFSKIHPRSSLFLC